VETKTTQNRDRLNAILETLDPKSQLASEIRYWQSDVGMVDENDNPRTPDLAECFDNVESIATDNCQTYIINQCRDILIRSGYYRVMAAHEVENTVVYSTSGRSTKVWNFKIKGVPYTADDSFSVWLSK